MNDSMRLILNEIGGMLQGLERNGIGRLVKANQPDVVQYSFDGKIYTIAVTQDSGDEPQ